MCSMITPVRFLISYSMFALRDDRRGVAGDAKGQGEDASENPAKIRTGPNVESEFEVEAMPEPCFAIY